MTHGDDSGLILPPKVAPYQVVIVPIPRGNWQETVLPKCQAIRDELAAAGIRVMLDDRDSHTPGLEVRRVGDARRAAAARDRAEGHREAGRCSRRAATRAAKASLPIDGLPAHVTALLDAIQAALLAKARAFREEHTTRRRRPTTSSGSDGRPSRLRRRAVGGHDEARPQIKAETQATLRNMPFGSTTPTAHLRELQRPAVVNAWFAKAYYGLGARNKEQGGGKVSHWHGGP